MKKSNVINLIRYHSEGNDMAFQNEACEIARDFDKSGDHQLASYIMALVSDVGTFVPQFSEHSSEFLTKMDPPSSSLPLPTAISDDVTGICNAIAHNAGINKFLFQGPPGTGKTETAKQIARIVRRDIYSVDFNTLIDCKLGETSKNIARLFEDINTLPLPEQKIIFFDEIDALVLDRIDQNDVREMGRATSSFLKAIDSMNDKIVLIAATNLYGSLDKALVRRFDTVIDFDRYTREDLIDIAESITNELLIKFNSAGRDMRLLKKIVEQMNPIPYPGELQNMLKSALAFSSLDDPFDYLRRFYAMACPKAATDLPSLYKSGFTIREISTLTGIPSSTVGYELKGVAHE